MGANDLIQHLLSDYERSLNTSDALLAASCYAADGAFIAPGLPAASGAEVLPAYERIFGTIRLDVSFTIDDLTVACESTAFALTHSEGTQTVLATGVETKESNRELFVFVVEGSDWKISRYLFNKPE